MEMKPMLYPTVADQIVVPLTFPGRTEKFPFLADHPSLVASEHSYPGDMEIYGEGESAEYVYQVVCGAVRTYKTLNDGRRQISAFHLPGDVFGLECGGAHSRTAEAVVDTTARVMKRSALERAARTDAKIACSLWTTTAAELRHAEDRMMLLGRKTAAERVANFLLEMDRRLSAVGMVELPMCRRDIADYLGLTVETVSRTLSDLNQWGALCFSGPRQFTLLNRERLAAMDM
jgi:CRP/FNR family transcriptional regulator, nitrogen fixation regulation protein